MRSTLPTRCLVLSLLLAGPACAESPPVGVASGVAEKTAAADGPGDWKMFEKPGDDDLKTRLTPEQYEVTQRDGTEPPFRNEFWDNKKKGIYVDVVSGEPLFSSNEKYASGTGWPSFWAPIEKENVVEKEDKKLFMTRTEVRSKRGDSHLGHLFPDGPQPTGMRYCINSAALRFIPVEEMESEGYGEYLSLFEDSADGGDAAKND